MNTKDFMIETKLITRQNIAFDDKWPIGLDVGYSSVKLFSSNTIAMFPSYAKRIVGESYGENPSYYMKYIDGDTGEEWVVGQSAYDALSSSDITDSNAELFGRTHYFSPTFKVILRVGLALATQSNSYGSPVGKEICVQTGLPSKYIKEDRTYITEALSGLHRFSLQLGNNPPRWYEININPKNVFVIPQPLGTLYSACFNNDGTPTDDASFYFSTSGIVFDPGFGTLDTFPVQGKGGECETFDNLGMKRVLEETISLIRENYGVELSIPAMQQCLNDNAVKILDRRSLSIAKKPIDEFLDIANRKVCEMAIEQILNSYNYLVDYNYIILTGGTGAAWASIIKEKLKNMETLKIIDGNRNDDLPMVFSNSRGYFLNLCSRYDS